MSGHSWLGAFAGVAVVLMFPVPRATAAETLQTLLDSGAVESTTNPVAATFFVEQGVNGMEPALAERATAQLKTSLRRQSSAISLTMQSATSMGSGAVTQQVNQRMQAEMGASGMGRRALAGALGVQAPGPQVTQREMQAMQREMVQGFADPWIRGIEAARAMVELGDAQAAGRFYVNCIQMVSADWLKDGALIGILAMGPRRSGALLTWMAENAEEISFMQSTLAPPERDARNPPPPDVATIAIRGAALRGLGTLIGANELGPDERVAALATLQRFASGKENAPYYTDAATGLGRTREAAAVPTLQRLVKWRQDERVAEAANAGLAIYFHEPAAAQRLRRQLDVKESEDTLRVLPWLLAAGDSATFDWSVQAVTGRRVEEATYPDLRPQVVRELTVLPEAAGRAALERIAAQGAGNDWLQAWVALALLELGDTSRLPAVLAAMANVDWTLDRPGLRYYWSRLQPYLSAAAGMAMGGTVSPKQIAQLIANTAMQELARRRANASDRAILSVQFRWQAAAVFGALDDPAAVTALIGLLEDEELSVRLSAASALAISPNAQAIAGIARALALDFGSENGLARAPQIRAALVRSAVLRFPDDPQTHALCAAAAADPDAGVRFIALVAMAAP